VNKEAWRYLANQILYDMFNLQRELHKHINNNPESQQYLNPVWEASELMAASARTLRDKLNDTL
jgi:hypothetical protein